MRLTRLIIGAAVILLALWVLLGEQLAGTSTDAVVNARLSTIRAPIAGRVVLGARSLGASVQQGEELGTITDAIVDRVRLDDLQMERGIAQAELTRADSLLRAAEGEIGPLDERTATFRAERIAEIESRLEHARARLVLQESTPPVAAPAAAAVPATATTGAEDPLAGSVDEVQPDAHPEAAGAEIAPSIALDYARERVDLLETELRAAEAGVFLAGGYNDAPWSEQQAAQLRTLVEDRRAARVEAASRLEAIDGRLTAARLSTSRVTGAPLSSTVRGQVWEVRADNGEHVQRGQDVMVLLDCESLFVTLSVTESVYSRLAVGSSARFRLSGDGRDYAATVIRLGGSGALTLYRNLAIAPSQKHLERFDVALLVPELATAEGLSCPVGRVGRVFFDRRPLDWLRGL